MHRKILDHCDDKTEADNTALVVQYAMLTCLNN